MQWQFSDRVLTFDRALVMGIVNVTPDSFSDGGQFASTEAAVAHGLELIRQGADILDIGGESTRPDAVPVPLEEELKRVVSVVEQLAKHALISIDTSKAEVARRCLAAGARIVNDVTALQGDPEMAEVVRSSGAGVILMHMQGTPATMQVNPHYDDVMSEIIAFLEARLQWAVERGIAAPRVALDPGVGFGKTHAHNLEILARLDELQRLGRPVCLGASRKGFIGKITGRTLAERRAGSVATVCHAVCNGAAQIVRVHDVADSRDAVVLLATIEKHRRGGGETP